MELADILVPDGVLYCTDVANKRQLFTQMAAIAAHLTGLEPQDITEAITSREALGSTGLGNGLAIPHGKLAGLKQVQAVFARIDPPIDFDSVDDQPVDLVVMLLAPIGFGADHLKALSRVARLLRTESVVSELRSLRDPQALYRVLTAPSQAHYAA